MTKPNLKIVNDQDELIFNAVENAGRRQLAQSLKKSPYSRATVASHMTDILGINVTEDMINNWCSNKPTHRIPLFWAHAFCRALGTDDWAIFEVALSDSDHRSLATAEEVRQRKVGKLIQERDRIDQELAKLK